MMRTGRLGSEASAHPILELYFAHLSRLFGITLKGSGDLMRSKLCTVTIIVLALLPASSLAGDQPERLRISDLTDHSFVVGDLKITLKRIWAGSLLSRGYIEVRAENSSDIAATFDPQRLAARGQNVDLRRGVDDA